ncbi:hypothetical protein ACXR6G_06540 [Ancylomarina sp. YFZ004]
MNIQRQNLMKWLTLALMICLMCGVNSCSSSSNGDDDDDVIIITSPYVGTWERTDIAGLEKQVMVITESNLEMTIKIYVEDVWIDSIVAEASFTVNGNTITLTINRIGMLNDEMTGFDYYTPNDSDWDLILEGELEIDEIFIIKFVVTGNQLLIISDDNEDGVFDAIEEGETFTKV